MAADLFRTIIGADGKLPGAADQVELEVTARRFNRNLLILLIATEIFLVIIDATINYQAWIAVDGVRRLANIAREDGLATWIMAMQTLFTGLTALLVYLVARGGEDQRADRAGWLFLAGFFSFMAIDDAAQIHERLGSAFSYYAQTGAGPLGRLLDLFPSYPWQIILLPFFTAAGIFMFFFLWSRLGDNRGRTKMTLAIAFIVVALFLDFVEGLEPGDGLNIFNRLIEHTNLSEDFVLHFAKVLEEFLEMLAMTLLLSTFFIHLSRSVGTMRVRFITGGERED